MACMKLGSKADVFRLEGQSWLCTTGLPSDICIKVGDTSFHLHKFPLLSRSQLLDKLIQDLSVGSKSEDLECVLSLDDLPGGANSFLLVAKFCYSIRTEITAVNVVILRCAAEYLQMTEDYGQQNLISHTECFLDEMFESWADTIKALQTCMAVFPLSDELHIISRCIDSLATKAITGPGATRSPDWWYADVAILELPLFKRLILAVGSTGMAPDKIAGSVMFYAKRYLLLSDRQTRFQKPGSRIHVLSDADQRALIEEIIELLPDQKSATATKFLLRLLRISLILHASPLARDNLERRIGACLDQVVVQDLLIPNTGYSMETLYDIECVQRIVNHFLIVMDQESNDSNLNSVVKEDELVECHHSLTPVAMVANLLENYLAEVASDVNLKPEKFLQLAALIPGNALLDDGIYRAIDIYLKAHPRLTDSEREHLCRLINCQKLSLEACSHAAQNERLPLRIIVQVLFFEQLRLRTSVAGCLFVSDNLDKSENLSGNMGQRNETEIQQAEPGGGHEIIAFDDMRERVSELEKECENMKIEMRKLVKTRSNLWNNLCKRIGVKFKAKSFELKATKMLPCNGEAIQPSGRDVLNGKKGC